MPRETGHKEGKDFKWVTNPAGHKTRHFFTAKEKAAMKAPKTKDKAPASKAKPKSKPAPKADSKGPKSRPNNSPAVRKAKTAEAREKQRDRMMSFDPVETKGSQANRRERNKRVPGRAILQAIGNVMSGKGETNPGKIASQKGSERSAKDLLRSPSKASGRKSRPGGSKSRGYSKGGVVKANCGASVKPKRG